MDRDGRVLFETMIRVAARTPDCDRADVDDYSRIDEDRPLGGAPGLEREETLSIRRERSGRALCCAP